MTDWQIRKLGDICKTSSGGTPSRKNKGFYDGGIPWVKSGELNFNTIRNTEEKISTEALKESSAKLFSKGTLLIALYGATVGKLAYLGLDATTNQAVCAIMPQNGLGNKYLYWYLFSKRKELVGKSIGGAQPNISQTILKDVDIPVPPLPTQTRIVEKIEELFSELDNGVENLKKAQNQLKTYRKAVLKDAFEGKLTKEWRQQQDDLPTPEELLKQVKAERKAHRQRELAEWEKEVEQWEKDGEPGRKPRKPRKQKDIDPIKQKELEKLSELPTEWIWIKFGEVFKDSPQNGLYKPKSDYGSGHEIVRIDNFYDGRMTGKLKKVNLSEDEISKYRIKTNNLLINRVNSLPYLGKCGLVTDKYSDSVFESNVMKVELNERIVVPKLLAYYLSSQTGTTQIRKNAKHAVNQASINQTDVANTLIPLTSVQEQGQILNEIESRLSVVDQLEQTINENLQKAEALRQSILKKAFGGELVQTIN